MYVETGKLASALRDKPEVPLALQEYCSAWAYLDRGRQRLDSGPQPIGIGSIRHYADMMGFTETRDLEALIHLIYEMELEWERWIAKQKERVDKQRKKPRPPKRMRRGR